MRIDFWTADPKYSFWTWRSRTWVEAKTKGKYIVIMSSKNSDKSSELGPLPPGWDTKFDPRTGR